MANKCWWLGRCDAIRCGPNHANNCPNYSVLLRVSSQTQLRRSFHIPVLFISHSLFFFPSQTSIKMDRTRAARASGSSRNSHPSPERYTLEDGEDPTYISPDSDLDDDDSVPPTKAAIQQQQQHLQREALPAVPDSPSRRSPPRASKQQQQLMNGGGGASSSNRDSWGAPRPGSYAERTNGARYRREGASSTSSHARSGSTTTASHQQPPPSSAWPAKPAVTTRPQQAGASSSSANRRAHGEPTAAAAPRHKAASPAKEHPINRLESPSIAKSVLQPLELKMNEYQRIMNDMQGQVAQLDEEIRQLQEKRRQTAERFEDAKAKHDDYERQHMDVERALRGESPAVQHASSSQQQQPTLPAYMPVHAPANSSQHVPMHRPGTMESEFQDEGRRPTSVPVGAGAHNSPRSRKMGTRDRIKMSLFGSG
ncbi:uncharacterized protein F5Z01DRAFT_655358 [Emericellopsis atlantica]|uniref:Uncharacterized protein n=1 Tax=Emericellopsis atlantica TaxID=2614577 RepID=A0A9P7ZMJ0_9HYPO|nr:uncharacterized protein F5Z01DRAFT_655358 [Emericellopsis atlantica]KAG9254462.1 hypothetical protein F5Z01DRAFT_655358 [Emericellopsis atlantica]